MVRRDELTRAVREPGFSPRKQDAGELFDLLAAATEADAAPFERALAHLGLPVAHAAADRLAGAPERIQVRLWRVIGRVALATAEPELVALLCAGLRDGAPRASRACAVSLGKLGASGSADRASVEAALLAAWDRDPPVELGRALAAALGKVGSSRSLARLREERSADAELGRIVREALAKLGRAASRQEPSRVEPSRRSPGRTEVAFHCRAGLESLLCDELGPKLEPRPVGIGRVAARLDGPLERLRGARLALRFTLVLGPVPLGPEDDLAVATAQLLGSARARALLARWTEGQPRYRLEWRGAGHQRAATWRCIEALGRLAPELVNDPRQCLWEVLVQELRRGRERALALELWPRGLPDERFAYRRSELAAASHPTLAAALARVAGARADDVVWDPFVGSATELIERARLGPWRRLVGTDRDARALAAARDNLSAAGVGPVELRQLDARQVALPERPTLVITNPPMGRRVLARSELEPLLAQVLRRGAELLVRGGRWVWLCPVAELGLQAAQQAGLRSTLRHLVDMGGFPAELQAFVKP